MAERTIWYALCELKNPSPEPFAVIAADVTKRGHGGIEATVVSLHMTREEAERVVHEFNNGPLS